MKPKHWSRPASIAFSLLFIAIMCFTLLPSPIPFGGAGVARAATTVTYSVAAGTDDVGVYYGTSWVRDPDTNTQVFFGNYAVNSLKYGEGLRFTGILVPQGAIITNAYLTFVCSTANTVNTLNAKIVGADVDNAGTGILDTLAHYQSYRGTDAGGADNTLRTTASVDWHDEEDWTPAGTAYVSVDISSVVQEIVNRGWGAVGNWTSGNAIVLFVDDHEGHSSTGALRYVASYDHLTYNAPELTITYTLAPTIVTLAATSITSATAILNGNVTDLSTSGNVTSYGFVLSTTTQSSPGNVSPSAQTTYTAGNWTWTGVQYAAGQTFDSDGNVTGLSKGACYYFRAAGYSTYGWVYGNELTFPTISDAPTGCTVSAYTSFSVSWSWTNGAGYGNSTWRYKAGSYPTSTTDGTSAYLGNLTSAVITGLTGNTTYYFTGWSLAYCNGATSVSTGNCSFTQKTVDGIAAFYYKKQLLFNTSATGANATGSNQANFPVAVHINSSSWANTTENANFFCAANVGGKRVQFFDPDQTNLDYEVELYNATGNTSTNEAIYWIRVPSVAGNSTSDSTWVAFGNDPNGTNQDNPTGVWDSSFKMVQHLGDNSWADGSDGTNQLRQRFPAMRYSGTYDRTYFTWLSGYLGGSVWINYFDSNTGIGTPQYLSTVGVKDTHHCPVLLVIPSGAYAGKILVAWTTSTATKLIRSSSAENIYAWEAEQTIEADGGAFPQLVHLGNGSDAIFYQNGAATNRSVGRYKTTSDGGTTWSASTTVVDFGDNIWNYPVVVANGNTVHLAWNHTGAVTYEDIHYAYSPDNLATWRTQGNATPITLPIDSAESELVRSHTGSWVQDIQIDGSGSPVIVWVENVDATTNLAYWAHYSSGWSVHSVGVNTLLFAGGTMAFNSGIFIDPVDTTHIYIGTRTGSTSTDIEEWHLTNHSTNTWARITQITSGSAIINGDPKPVMNYASYFKILYSAISSYIAYDVWNSAIYSQSTLLVPLREGADSTSNNNDGSNLGTSNTVGVVASGRDFDGANDYINLATTSFPAAATTRTISAWVKFDDLDSDYQEIFLYGSYANYQGFLLSTGSTAVGARNKLLVGTYFNNFGASTATLAAGTWAYVCFRITGDKAGTYTINTTSDNVNCSNSLGTVLNVGYIGKGWVENYPNGKIDEVRVSAGDRGADWIKLEYYSMAKTNFNGDNGVSAPFLSWEAAIFQGTPDISNTPSLWSVGVVQPSQTYWANGAEPDPWPLEAADCWGNLTNNSSFAVDISASMGNMIGGTTWTIGSSPGTNVFTIKIGIAGKANVGNFTTLSNTPVAWITSMVAGNMTRWTMVFYTPTNAPQFADGVLKSGNVTFEAEAS